MAFGYKIVDNDASLPNDLTVFTIGEKSRVRTPSGPPMVKNRRFVLAEMLRHEKHSDQELS